MEVLRRPVTVVFDTTFIALDLEGRADTGAINSDQIITTEHSPILKSLPGVLKDVGFSDRDARIAVALVVARMIHPSIDRYLRNDFCAILSPNYDSSEEYQILRKNTLRKGYLIIFFNMLIINNN